MREIQKDASTPTKCLSEHDLTEDLSEEIKLEINFSDKQIRSEKIKEGQLIR
jgi:hypothetical protein